ncbi:CRTAC1 family protein, partial [Thiogranum longum]|uniref:CRTAC1 family protein n=1 Tax=Thiogranum longum TaxID=1537524 RepID=UPI0010535E1E
MIKNNKFYRLYCLGIPVLLGYFSIAAHATVQFSDVTQQSGVGGMTYRASTNHTLGMCWIDFNSDGWPDLFAVNGYAPGQAVAHLYQNDTDGTFSRVDSLLPPLPAVEMAGCVFADYDNDGDSDIFIQTHNEFWSLWGSNPLDGPPSLLLKNQWVENGNQTIAGQPLFQEIAASAKVDGVVPIPLGPNYPARSSMTGGWLDYDRDGCIDLYVGQMILQAGGDAANTDTLYRNDCDGTFSDQTVASGVNPGTDPDTYRPALAFVGAHLDGDLWPDMVVVNVHEPAPHFEDFIYRNNGNGTFDSISSLSPGVGDDAGSGMGIDVSDLDNNGTWDMYITDVFSSTNDAQPLGNVLYLGNGDGTFKENSAVSAGVEAKFSWGTNFLDVDQDGFVDLYVGTREGILYENNGNGTFAERQVFSSFGSQPKGSATADYDRDGDLDLAIINAGDGGPGEGLQLFRNDSTNQGHWLQLKLVGSGAPQSNRDAIGSVVKLSAGGLNMMRQVKGGSSTHSQDSLVVHFGLGNATSADTLDVMWPSGITTALSDVVADACYTVTESGTVSSDDSCTPGNTGGSSDPLGLSGVSPGSVVAGSTLDMTITGTGIQD